MTTLAIISVGLIIFTAHFLAMVFEKTKIPDVLFLVLLGVLLGPLTHLIPMEFFGKIGGIFTTVALVIILFQGGSNISLHSLKSAMSQGSLLAFYNYLACLIAVAPIAFIYLHFSWLEALLLGSIVGGTSSIIVIPLVNQLKLRDSPRTSLILESSFSDVLCIMATLGLLDAFQHQDLNAGLMMGKLFSTFVLAAVIGGVAAGLWSSLLHRVHQLDNGMILTPAFVFIVFGVAEFLGYSGAIAALIFGIVIGNIEIFKLPILKRWVTFQPVQLHEMEKVFFSEIVFLLKTFFFIYIGLSIQFKNYQIFIVGIIITLAIFGVRMIVSRFSLKKELTRFEAAVIGATSPKGLAAAVLASAPLHAGVPNGPVIQEIVYIVILLSIVLTALLIYFLSKEQLLFLQNGWFKNFTLDIPTDTTITTERGLKRFWTILKGKLILKK